MRSASDLLRAIYDLFQPLAGSRKKNRVENTEKERLILSGISVERGGSTLTLMMAALFKF